MNIVILSGYLPADAVMRTSPSGWRKLTCELMSRDSRGETVETKLEIDREDLVREMEPLLTRGRAVIVHGEQAMREVKENGVLKYVVRFVRVLEIEVPNRSKARESRGEQASD